MHNVDKPALAVAILFLVFIAYEIAGGSDLFPQLHTVSYYAQNWEINVAGYHIKPLMLILFAAPPAVYQGWWLWHMSQVIIK